MGNGAVMLGHKHPAVQKAVAASLRSGLTTGLESEAGIRAARAVPEAWCPAPSGCALPTPAREAMLHVLHMARAITGRQRIAKVEGAYHGWFDSVHVSTWPPLDKAGPDDAPIAMPGHRRACWPAPCRMR